MATDASDLRASIEQWAQDVHRQAVEEMLAELDVKVPRGPHGDTDRGEPALADSVEVLEIGSMTTQVAYTAEHATFTDEGTAPHEIRGNPLLAFEWEGQLVIVHSVQHPGTTGTRWWSDTMTDERWAEALQHAADSTTLP